MDLDFLKLSWHYFQNNNNIIKIVHLNQHILNKYLYYPESISLTQTTARRFKPKGIFIYFIFRLFLY